MHQKRRFQTKWYGGTIYDTRLTHWCVRCYFGNLLLINSNSSRHVYRHCTPVWAWYSSSGTRQAYCVLKHNTISDALHFYVPHILVVTSYCQPILRFLVWWQVGMNLVSVKPYYWLKSGEHTSVVSTGAWPSKVCYAIIVVLTILLLWHRRPEKEGQAPVVISVL